MSQYAAEPVPSSVDPELAEYLMRQFIGIQYGVGQNQLALPIVSQLPKKLIEGAMVVLEVEAGGDKTFNGLWICQPDSNGIFKWRRLVPDNRDAP